MLPWTREVFDCHDLLQTTANRMGKNFLKLLMLAALTFFLSGCGDDDRLNLTDNEFVDNAERWIKHADMHKRAIFHDAYVVRFGKEGLPSSPVFVCGKISYDLAGRWQSLTRYIAGFELTSGKHPEYKALLFRDEAAALYLMGKNTSFFQKDWDKYCAKQKT